MKLRIPVLIMVAALTFAACSGEASPTPTPGQGGGGGGGGDLAGTKVTILGAFVDQEQTAFEEAVRPFEEATGVDVVYDGTKEFETLINVQVEGGNPPDIAALPQPGVMRRFAEQGKLVPLSDSIVSAIDTNYGPGWKELGTGADGKVYGVFHRVNVKSLVFYPRKAFEAAGYSEPSTWAELIALQDRIKGDGGVPWCIGIESGTATGWPATDWIEDIMLRTAGLDTYNKWVAHEIPFNDPAVVKAAETMGEIWLDPTLVYGGSAGILTTNFGDAPTPMFDDTPGCWLHRQGNFITGFFPDRIKENLDEEVGVFPFPEIDPQYGVPALGGGDQFVAFADRPEVMALLEYLTTGESGASWAREGGALFPHLDQDLDNYGTAIERAAAELLLNADSFGFDASDQMPASVGAGSFWAQMVEFVNGKPINDALDAIEASWPAS